MSSSSANCTDMNIIYKDLKELIPYARNNKKHNERQINTIASSIKEFGFNQPIVIDSENVIIVGHGRVLACEKLKIKEVPCVIKDDLTEAQIKAYRIADNRLSELGEWDEEMLNLELEDLKNMDIDIELTGFDSDELDDLLQIEEEIEKEREDKSDKIKNEFNIIIECENEEELEEKYNELTERGYVCKLSTF